VNIRGLHVDGFGVWSNLTLESFDPGLNVFYGPNEAGKTTLLQFVRSVLYGFSPDRRGFLLPPGAGRSGGAIEVDSPNGRYNITRHDDQSGGVHGAVTLTSAEGMRQGEHFLKVLLSDVDEKIFNNVFAVSLLELQELATLSDTAAADQLYRITAGLDRVSLVDVLRELNTSRSRMLSPRGEPCQVVQLLAEREKLQGEIAELAAGSRRYGRLAGEHNQLQREVLRLQEEQQQAENGLRLAELALQVRPRWERRAELDRQLATLNLPPLDPSVSLERLELVAKRLKQSRRGAEELKRSADLLRRDLGNLKIDQKLSGHAARIEALAEQRSWAAQLESRIAESQQEVLRLETQLRIEREQAGLGAASKGGRVESAARLMATLRPIAQAVQRTADDARKSQERAESVRQNAREVARKYDEGLAAHGETDLAKAMDRIGAEISQLRRRQQIDDRLNQMSNYQAELADESGDLLDHHFLPMWVVVGLGALLMLGVMFIVVGLFLPTTITTTVGWFMAIAGAVSMIGAVVIKIYMERSHASQVESHHRQSSQLQSQYEQVVEERDQLDRQLARGGGPISQRLQTAQQRLAELEELVPLESRRKSAAQDAARAEHAINQAQQEHQAARKRWKSALAAANLPPDLTLKRLKGFVERAGELDRLAERLEAAQRELASRQADLEGFTTRVASIAADVGLDKLPGSTATRLQALAEAAGQQKAAVQQRRQLRRQLRQAGTKYRHAGDAYRRWKQRRRDLLRRAGVNGEEEFRDLAARHSRAEELHTERAALQREIAAALGGNCSEEALAGLLNSDEAPALESRRKEWIARRQTLDQQLRERLEKRGELSQSMRAIADQRELSTRQLALNVVEQKLEDALARWQVLAVTSRMLDAIRSSYEIERQPESLKEASLHLERLTMGRYRRVWVPLGEAALLVDDAQGNARGVELLSRGTREQLFLALRLALVAAYRRRGAALPMVLDDVLVNFDVHRAKAAAEVLRDFAAQGHQVLVFTCHEHVYRMFQGLRVAARLLPDREGGAPPVVVEEPPVEDRDEKARRRPRRVEEPERRRPKVVPQPPPVEAPEPIEPPPPQPVVEVRPEPVEVRRTRTVVVEAPPAPPPPLVDTDEGEFDEYLWEEADDLGGRKRHSGGDDDAEAA